VPQVLERVGQAVEFSDDKGIGRTQVVLGLEHVFVNRL
jgi:hypothetical protein